MSTKRKLLRAYYACMSHRDLISSMLANIGRMIVDDDLGIQEDKIYERGVALSMEEARFALAIKDFLSILDSTDTSSPLKILAPGAKFRYIDPPDTYRGVWIKTRDFDGDHLYRVVRISDGDLRRESGSTTVDRADLDISDSGFVLQSVPQIAPRFRLLAKWEGFVLSVGDETFVAELHDLIGSEPVSQAEFLLDEIPESDRSLVQDGATFYWNVGYNVSTSGQIERAAYIYFRKTRSVIRREAEALGVRLGWSDE